MADHSNVGEHSDQCLDIQAILLGAGNMTWKIAMDPGASTEWAYAFYLLMQHNISFNSDVYIISLFAYALRAFPKLRTSGASRWVVFYDLGGLLLDLQATSFVSLLPALLFSAGLLQTLRGWLVVSIT